MEYLRAKEAILTCLDGEIQSTALHYLSFLSANKMCLERGKGYWSDKQYWLVKYKGEYSCFLQICHPHEKENTWIVWSDDSGRPWYANPSLEPELKKTALENIVFCANCGGSCSPGKTQIIFDRTYHHVCRTTFRFTNPNSIAVSCLKELLLLRINDINRLHSQENGRDIP